MLSHSPIRYMRRDGYRNSHHMIRRRSPSPIYHHSHYPSLSEQRIHSRYFNEKDDGNYEHLSRIEQLNGHRSIDPYRNERRHDQYDRRRSNMPSMRLSSNQRSHDHQRSPPIYDYNMRMQRHRLRSPSPRSFQSNSTMPTSLNAQRTHPINEYYIPRINDYRRHSYAYDNRYETSNANEYRSHYRPLIPHSGNRYERYEHDDRRRVPPLQASHSSSRYDNYSSNINRTSSSPSPSTKHRISVLKTAWTKVVQNMRNLPLTEFQIEYLCSSDIHPAQIRELMDSEKGVQEKYDMVQSLMDAGTQTFKRAQTFSAIAAVLRMIDFQ